MSFSLPADEAARLESLRCYEILDTPPEPCFDHITSLARRLFNVSIAYVALMDSDRQWFKSIQGADLTQVPRAASFCSHVVLSRQVLVVPDMLQDARFADSPYVAGPPDIRFYAGAPLLSRGGHCIGSLGIADGQARVMSEEDLRTLTELTEMAAALVERRRQQKEALYESETHYATLIQNLNEIVYFVERKPGDERTRVLMMSEQVTAVTGRRPDAFLGDADLWFRLIHPEDEARVRHVHAMLRETRQTQACEFRILHNQNSEYHWLETKLVPRLDEAGELIGMWGVARDISARKQDEQRLRLLESAVVHANDAIIITEAEPIGEPGPRILYVNEAFTRMTGYSREDVIGQTPRILQGTGTSRAQLDEIRAALKAWKPIQVELQNYRKDGSPFWEELSIVPVADESGWFTHWVSVQRETTQRRQSELALQQAKEEAEAAREEAESANSAKSEFLSRMSHELRTPMNAILGFAQLFELDSMSADDRDGVGQILKAGGHLLTLINEVLDISRIEAGGLALAQEPVSVREMVRSVRDLMQPLAATRGVTLSESVSGPGTADLCALADPQRLKQVLLNLVSNAIKYNAHSGAVSISCRQFQAPSAPQVLGEPRLGLPGEWLSIEVSDTGPGISSGDLGRLFTPFERLNADSATEGTGIGLALSKRLAELMGGRVGVQSVLGAGSTFSIEMPRADSPSQAAATPCAGGDLSRDAACVSDEASLKTVLYIEDNSSNLKLVERILSRRPEIRLLSAMRGGLGLEMAREHRPDLILLDLHLPDIDGSEVLARLRADARLSHVPVVVLSADATPRQVQSLLDAGAQDYLTKPLDVKQLLQILEQQLAARPTPHPAPPLVLSR